MEKAFKENEVLLWGLNPVKKSLLAQYDKGNKNPFSTSRKGKKGEKEEEKETPKKVVKKAREFSLDEDYSPADLDFLNSEYDRIDKALSSGKLSPDEEEELTDKQDKLYELIEGLEAMKKLQGGSLIKKHIMSDTIVDDDMIGSSIGPKKFMEMVTAKMLGKGFKKGSPEAAAHAEKMRKAIEAKKAAKAVPVREPVKQATKARAEKGSEAAKELGRRLAEARKKKAEAKKTEKEEEKKKVKQEKTKNYKPWYYIGDIPRGYREATEDEAITHGKVSKYGKYIVDHEKYKMFDEFDMLLSVQRPENEIKWSMNGIKRRIMKSLEDIEIYKAKLENEKYEKQWPDYETKLKNEKLKRKTLQAGWNWYNKYFSEKEGKPYKREKFELEKRIQTYEPSVKREYKKPVIIDPRTGKPVEEYTFEEEKKEPEKKQTIDVDLFFKKETSTPDGRRTSASDTDIIRLSTKYFTPDYKLKPKYTEKLLKKGIILQRKHYTPEDYEKYFYKIAIGGGIEGYSLIKSN